MRLDHKPNSVSGSCRIMVIHLVSTSRSSSCDLPIRNVRTIHWIAWSCSRRGLPSYSCFHKYWWSLTPPFHLFLNTRL